METKHTPGPWTNSGDRIGTDQTGTIAMIYRQDARGSSRSGVTPTERESNARLIAAAPDLLAALQVAENTIRWAAQEASGRVKAEIVGGWLHHAEQARAVIAKATGVQQ